MQNLKVGEGPEWKKGSNPVYRDNPERLRAAMAALRMRYNNGPMKFHQAYDYLPLPALDAFMHLNASFKNPSCISEFTAEEWWEIECKLRDLHVLQFTSMARDPKRKLMKELFPGWAKEWV
jgi:hypothetical protein